MVPCLSELQFNREDERWHGGGCGEEESETLWLVLSLYRALNPYFTSFNLQMTPEGRNFSYKQQKSL